MFKKLLMFLGFVVCSAFIEAKQYRYKTDDLFQAVKVGYKRDVKQYLKSGVDVNALDTAGKTVLDYAVENKHKKIVLMLVKHKAMVTTQKNLATVKQVITSRYRFLKAIGSVFGGIALLFLGGAALFVTSYMLTFYGFSAVAAVVLMGYALFFELISIPFKTAVIGWKDRAVWYNPNLITANVAVVR